MPDPIAGAEDFSRVLQAVPGAMLFLGACVGDDWQSAADNHSPFAAFSDEVLPAGAALYTDLAVASLAKAAGR
jgi:hippurate hydrolase